jgi:O-antigen ligase
MWKISLLVAVSIIALMLWFLRLRLAPALIAAPCAYWAAVQKKQDSIKFLQFLIITGVFEAFMGLVQFFVSPGWIFGYLNPYYRVSGTLINHNHFAGLLEMIVPVSWGLALICARRFGDWGKVYLYVLAGVFMTTAVLFSLSRMGIVSLICTMFFLSAVVHWRKPGRRLALGLTLAVVGLATGVALWVGVDVVIHRYAELSGEEAVAREGRLIIFSDVIRMIKANPMGVGPGQFEDQFRKYQSFRPELNFDHAHNDYLETAAEWGIPVAAIFWGIIFIAFARATRLATRIDSPERQGIFLACSGAIFSILVHSLADFNLQIPSNAILFFTFVGISFAPIPKNTGKPDDIAWN